MNENIKWCNQALTSYSELDTKLDDFLFRRYMASLVNARTDKTGWVDRLDID